MNTVSGTGVAFTRNPGTGENIFYGKYVQQAPEIYYFLTLYVVVHALIAWFRVV